MKNKIAAIVGAVVVLIGLFFVGTKLYKSEQSAEVAKIAESNSDKFMPAYAPTLGPQDAKIKLVEFMDPECESCSAFHPYLKSIMHDFDGKIQLFVRYAPFHPDSKFAIKILEGARKQGKYWETLEVLYKYQPQWGSHENPQPELIWNYLPEAGVDVNKLKADLVEFSVAELLEKEIKDGKELGVKGTPTFFVNGKLLERFHPDALREMIQKELEAK